MTGLSVEKLESFLSDIKEEPQWRMEADREADYYDNNQLSSEVLQQMQDRGIAPLVRNLIAPTVDVVLGMEAKNKRDWKVTAEDDSGFEAALALNRELKEAERVTRADNACSHAYAHQIKVGLGWVEVAREHDPFKPPYRVQHVHRKEIYWDWRAKDEFLTDARYLVRKQWKDEDVVKLTFPGKASIIDNAMNDWPMWDESSTNGYGTDLARAFDVQSRSTLEDAEWRDVERRRIAVYEVWYRFWKKGIVMILPDGSVMEYDNSNMKHINAVVSGAVKVHSTLVPQVRLSWWVGPHRLADIPSPYKHNMFPYVPFWGYREDSTGIPYGIIRRMMSPQDEVNSRLSKMYWLLSAKRVRVDSDALEMPHEEAMEELSRPDAYIVTNPHRKRDDGLDIESDFALSQQQFQVMQDASVAIQDTGGVYQSMLGKQNAGAESGIAINSLVEQGATTLAEINDNYRSARKYVGELLLALVKEDIGLEERVVRVEVDGRARTVYLNKQEADEAGYIYRTNDLARLRAHVELEDVPNTPSYRAQQLQMLTEITKSLPPELQSVIADLWVRATDLPQRGEIADRIARATGQKQQNLTPEEEAEMQEEQRRAEEERNLALAAEKAKVDETNAKVEKLLADVALILQQVQKTAAETDKLEVETELADEQQMLAVEKQAMDGRKMEADIAAAKRDSQKPRPSKT